MALSQSFSVKLRSVSMLSSLPMVKSAPRLPKGASMQMSATTKIDILSREMELTDTLKFRVDSKIGKVIDHDFYVHCL